MAKKKRWTKELAEELLHLGPPERPGRKSTKQKRVDDLLTELTRESDRWVRKTREDWLRLPLIKDAVGASTRLGLPTQYDDAIDAVQKLIAFASVAEDYLRQGRAVAVEKLAARAEPPQGEGAEGS